MNNEYVNELVLSYRNGNESALGEIFKYLSPLIEKSSEMIRKVSDDPTKFDCRVLLKLKRALDGPEVYNFASYAKTVIGNERSDFLTRRKRKRDDVSMTALEGDSEENLGYQFKANEDVESDVDLKERVTLLAQGNPRKKVILTQWSRGAEDKAISELLAQLFGGNATGHRSFIKRFKTECRTRLASEYLQ